MRINVRSTLQPNNGGGPGAVVMADLPPTAHHAAVPPSSSSQGLVFAGQMASIYKPSIQGGQSALGALFVVINWKITPHNLKTKLVNERMDHTVRGHVYMMSENISDFLTPPAPLICIFTQPPLICFHTASAFGVSPSPLLVRTSYVVHAP